MTEYEKMIAGELYRSSDPDLLKKREFAHDLCTEFNSLKENDPRRKEIISLLFPTSSNFYFQGPIYFDYGINTTIGKGSYANFNLTVLDVCPVTIGEDVFFGPNVALYTAMHPFLSEERKTYFDEEVGYETTMEYAKPIKIGDGCWFGGNVVVLPGVTIGKRCIIGAGSVVTHDIPNDSLAYGSPCRVVRKITEKDRIGFREGEKK